MTSQKIAAFFLFSCIILLILFAMMTISLHAQPNMGAMKTPQINTDYFVGQVPGFYPNIQNATNKACTTSGSRVIIPAGTTTPDTPTTTAGCTQVPIEDRRTIPTTTYGWNGSLYVSRSPVGSVASVSAFGAIDDGTTDNTAAFNTMETSAANDFYLPLVSAGVYKTSQTNLSKRYWGPGCVGLNNANPYSCVPGISASVGNVMRPGKDGMLSFWGFSGVDVDFLGDSKTQGYVGGAVLTPANVVSSYPYKIQNYMNVKSGGVGQGSFQSGGSIDRWATTGTVTPGTHGPLGGSEILGVGATMSFTGSFMQTIILTTYNKPGGGTLTISGQGGVWGTCNTSVGTVETKCAPMASPDGVNYKSQTITITSSVGTSELTNIVAATLPTTSQTSTFFQVHARGGYSTTQFANNAVLDSIAFNRAFTMGGLYSTVVIDVMLNDVFNTSNATTPTQAAANLDFLISGLKSRGMQPILVIPYRPAQTTVSQPIYAPFDVYRNIWLAKARKYGIRVIDMSELNLADSGDLGADGVHPTETGYSSIANFFLEKGFALALAAPPGRFANNISTVADPTSFHAVDYGDKDNVNRGFDIALDNATTPIGSIPLKSLVRVCLFDCIYSSFGGVIRLQTGNYVDRLVINSSLIHTTLPFDINGGVTINTSNALPQVGTPTVGQAACIKASGPPVVIGYCSSVVGAGGACTCN